MRRETHVEESQKLLNAVAAARLCLLDADKKWTYDAALQAAAVGEPAARKNGPSSSPTVLESIRQSPGSSGSSSSAAQSSRGMLSTPKTIPIAGIAVIVAFCFSQALWLWFRHSSVPPPGVAQPSLLVNASQQSPSISPATAEPPVQPDQLILAAIPDQTVTAGEQIGFTVNAKSLHNRPLSLRYRLDPDSPEGASIDAESRAISVDAA